MCCASPCIWYKPIRITKLKWGFCSEHKDLMLLAKSMLLRYVPPLKLMIVLIFLIHLVLSLSACQSIRQSRSTTMATIAGSCDLKSHNEAIGAYLMGDYEGAAERFATVHEQTANPVIARMALFGLACSRLMTADGPEAYQRALTLWDAWVYTDPTPGMYEDARLLAPVVRQKMLLSHIPPGMEGVESLREGEAVSEWFMIQAEQELRRLNARLEAADAAIKGKDERIASLEQEINRLNQQIEALEEIDQKIHQRKRAIPTTE